MYKFISWIVGLLAAALTATLVAHFTQPSDVEAFSMGLVFGICFSVVGVFIGSEIDWRKRKGM